MYIYICTYTYGVRLIIPHKPCCMHGDRHEKKKIKMNGSYVKMCMYIYMCIYIYIYLHVYV